MLQKFEQYLSKEKNYSPHTIRAYLHDIQAFQSFLYDSHIDLFQATAREVRNWMATLSRQNQSEKTINRKIASLKSFYKFLLKTGSIIHNPLQHISGLKVRKKIPVPFSTAEMNNLFEPEVFNDDFEGLRDKAIIALLYTTGIRRAELINIQPQDIDFVKNELKVLGKRNKERIVPLLFDVRDFLKNYLKVKENFFESNAVASYFFLTSKGKKMYEMLVYRLVNSYLSRVSVKHKKSPHMIRHTFATHLLNNGADLNAIKELLGHTSLAATQVYTHSSIKQLKKVYNQAHPRSKKQ